MLKKNSKLFVVDHGSYPFDVLVCIGSTHKEICDYIEKKNKYKLSAKEKEELGMSGKGLTVMLLNGATVLRIDELKTLDFRASLAHEIFHAVEFLFDRVGIKHDTETSGEAFAYQIQYLTGSIYEKLKRS